MAVSRSKRSDRRTDRSRRDAATRPPLPEGTGRRALSNLGGPVVTSGDPVTAGVLARALDVRTAERDATLTHPFHAYPARMHPETARGVVAHLAATGAHRVLDPFCGSGTVLVEAFAAGLAASGSDLSPIAVELATLKTRRTTPRQRQSIVRRAHQIAERAVILLREGHHVEAPPSEHGWYPRHTLNELALLRALIEANDTDARSDDDRDPIVARALRMLLSSILVKVSFQRSDSDPRRVERHIGPRAATTWFARKSIELSRCLEALAVATRAKTPEPEVSLRDASEPRPDLDGHIDAIVTSPPYANTYDYAAQHERRYAWLDLDAEALRAHEIGAVRSFRSEREGTRRFANDLIDVCRSFARTLRPGGFAYVLMGDGCAGRTALRADEMLHDASLANGLVVVAMASQRRPTFSPAEREAFGAGGKFEHLIALQRRTSKGPTS